MSYLLVKANALRIPLADESVQCVVTSPPYWGLRDYGVAGQLGLEPTPDEFVANMVRVFREVRRVLRGDGTCWVNLGDSYVGANNTNNGGNANFGSQPGRTFDQSAKASWTGLLPKNLIGIPWRVALALQADGWYLRSDIIWAKPNPMPESVTDRPTKSHEYMFLLSKSERYYFDQEAVRESAEYGRGSNFRAPKYENNHSFNNSKPAPTITSTPGDGGDRNIRTVWNIATESYPGAHFATYPRKLVMPCINAGTSEKGCCPECGKGWEREVESERVATRPGTTTKINGHSAEVIGNRDPGRHVRLASTTGWRPACSHGHDPIPCTVFDPFAGSGTTGVVALALKRRFIGLDLSEEYLKLASQRISRPHAKINRPGKAEHHPLFDGVE
jgi:DNA modification methylase